MTEPEPPRPSPGYAALLAGLDAWFARGRVRAGAGVVPCQRSCSACCHGVFDISPADARLLAEGLATLPADVAATLRERATAQLARCTDAWPDWGPPWSLEQVDEAALDALCDRLAAAPCPALAADGGCALYEQRPATCRMTGLSMDTGAAGRLDNECPIQADHPRYAALPPEPFDLLAFEELAAAHDAAAAAQGFAPTTVAGALARRSEDAPTPGA